MMHGLYVTTWSSSLPLPLAFLCLCWPLDLLRPYIYYQSVLLLRIEEHKQTWGRKREIGETEMGSTHCDDSLDFSVKIPAIKFTKLFINGEFVDSISGFQLSTSCLLPLLFRLAVYDLRYKTIYCWFLRYIYTYYVTSNI